MSATGIGEFMNPGDVRMLQSGGGFCGMLQALTAFGTFHDAGGQHLDGNGAVHLCVHGPVENSRPILAELRQDLVVGYGLADQDFFYIQSLMLIVEKIRALRHENQILMT